MKTVVYQSYLTSNVPAWIERCLATVRDQTLAQSSVSHFIDDRLFDS